MLSVDEAMVAYYGHHSAKMFIKNKPVRSIPISQQVKDLLAIPDVNSSNFNKNHNAEEVGDETVNLEVLDTFIRLDGLQLSEEEIYIETCSKIKYELS
ncbi:hypothetical protein ILUMI_26029 [Ignelater luminosus]|uniref:Uncharacterized protein n=1 Tax=Ignelater luminosus TaxID=2038154 RepID=A0A8K0FW16_IGNLU|nr:hypothetical protein ILUMI_26029 [Ignelater luminosus]